MKFIFFHKTEEHTILGSDSYMRVDARCSNSTIIDKICSDNVIVRNKQKQGAIGFKIYTGSILDATPITNLIKFV